MTLSVCFKRQNLFEKTALRKISSQTNFAHKRLQLGSQITEPISAGKVKGAQSWFAHIEKFGLNFSNSSFVIRVNLLHP